MKTTIIVSAVAALASAAAAQSLNLYIEADRTTANIGEMVTFTVTAEFDAGFFLTDSNFDLVASDNTLGVAGAFQHGSWAGATNSTALGASVRGITGGQSPLFGAIDASNPLVLGSFTVQMTGLGVLSYSAESITQGFVGNLFVTQLNNGSAFSEQRIFADPSSQGFAQISDTVQIVPAPGALALVGLGGLAAARRRR